MPVSPRPDPALGRELASAARDVTAPLAGLAMRPRDEVLLRRGGAAGVKIYQDLMRDPRVRAVLRKRVLAIVARDWQVDPASDRPADVAAARLVRAALAGLGFDRLTAGLALGLLTGLAVAELIWGPRRVEGRTWLLPLAAPVREPRRFVFGRARELRLLTPAAPVAGEACPERKFVVVRFGEEESEDPYGRGLGATLYWPVFFKRQGLAFWLTFAEKFGQPTALGSFPPGASQAEQERLLDALAALAQDSAVVVPDGMRVAFLEAQRSGTVDTYAGLVRLLDEQIAEAVLGESLTTHVGERGSYAAAATHDAVRRELTDADADLLSDALNASLVRWIVELNLPDAAPPTLWRLRPAGPDLAARAELYGRLASLGLRPDIDEINATFPGRWTRDGK